MMYRTRRLPWRNSFPRSGSCCVSNNPRGFLYLSAGYCCHWQDWPTCKVSKKKKKKKKDDKLFTTAALRTAYAAQSQQTPSLCSCRSAANQASCTSLQHVLASEITCKHVASWNALNSVLGLNG